MSYIDNIMENGVEYDSRLDKVLSAFYMIVETSGLDVDEVIDGLRNLDLFLNMFNLDNVKKDLEKSLLNFDVYSTEYKQKVMVIRLIKRIMYFNQVQNIEAFNTDLEIFIRYLQKTGLHNFT